MQDGDLTHEHCRCVCQALLRACAGPAMSRRSHTDDPACLQEMEVPARAAGDLKCSALHCTALQLAPLQLVPLLLPCAIAWSEQTCHGRAGQK